MGSCLAKKYIKIKTNKANLTVNNYTLTASKVQCRKVWTSYGIGRGLIAFVADGEKVGLQTLNKFAYNSLISRAWTRINLAKHTLNFVISNGQNYGHTVYKYDVHRTISKQR